MPGSILFVDDDQHLLDGLRLALRKHFSVTMALGPHEGLAKLRTQGPFAVVVSDLKMPGMDGVEFLAEVRRLSPDSVRIMLTGHGDLEMAMAAVNRSEVFRFLVKPCPAEALREALGEALDKHQRDGLGNRAVDALRAIVREASAGAQAQAAIEGGDALTPREQEIADLIRAGQSTKEIAQAFHLSSRTIETYRDNIRKKLGIANRKINLQSYLSKSGRLS